MVIEMVGVEKKPELDRLPLPTFLEGELQQFEFAKLRPAEDAEKLEATRHVAGELGPAYPEDFGTYPAGCSQPAPSPPDRERAAAEFAAVVAAIPSRGTSP